MVIAAIVIFYGLLFGGFPREWLPWVALGAGMAGLLWWLRFRWR